ncbi:MAG: STAS domain-containing protein [Myxococcota bacterium]
MNIGVEEAEGATRVWARGRLDVADVEIAQRHFEQALERGGPVRVELADASSMHSAWLGTLLAARATAMARGRELAVTSYGYALTHCLETLGLQSLLGAAWLSEADEVGYFFFDDVDP